MPGLSACYSPNKKAALWGAALERNSENSDLRGFHRFFLNRAGIEALGIDVSVHELDHGHRRVIAVAEARLDDAVVRYRPVSATNEGRSSGPSFLHRSAFTPARAPCADRR